jgi:hypothetical protein
MKRDGHELGDLFHPSLSALDHHFAKNRTDGIMECMLSGTLAASLRRRLAG